MAQELTEQTRALVRSRIPNYYSLTPEEAALEAIKVIIADFYIYTERNLMIRNKAGQIIPLEFNWAQRKFIDMVLEDLANGIPVRYIILKARQMGFSTAIEALCYWWTTTHKNISSLIMAHESKASKNLYEMSRRYYDYSHPFFQVDRKYNTLGGLVFDVSDEVKDSHAKEGQKNPGLASSIMTLVAKEDAGRSFTGTFLHGSEVAFWEATADIVSSVFQAIPRLPNTFVFLESTANGVGGYFYDEWQIAKVGKSIFKPLFFAWHQHYEYEIPGTIATYDEEEKELLELFMELNYPPESWDRKLLWRREKQKEFRTDPQKFYQEYPSTDTEAFLSSGRPVFDLKMLTKWERAVIDNSTHIYGEVIDNDDRQTVGTIPYIFKEIKPTFQDQDPTPLKVWELPDKDIRYTVGVDVSEGLEISANSGKTNDYSVIDIMRTDTLKTVARWRGHIDPDLLGEVCYKLGTFYNKALIGVEINNHGLTTVQSLRNKFYRNLYMRETAEDNQFQERTAKMGWRTDRKTKPVIINNLVTAIREADIVDLDIVFIRECMTYVRDDQGYTNAQQGLFDDTVMAKAINLEMARFNSINQEYAKDHIKKPLKRNLNGNNDSTTFDPDANGFGPRRTPSSRRTAEAVARRRQKRAAHQSRNKVS